MKKYLIANWKANMTNKQLVTYFNQINKLKLKNNTYLGFAVPSIYLKEVKQKTKWNVIAQDAESFGYGAHTGRLSYLHLLDNKINGAIIGHSEQRVFNDNTNEIINQKIKVLLKNKMTVILCVGEDIKTYKDKKTNNFIKQQLTSAFKGIDTNKYKKQIIIAYEPIWAIGTGFIPSNDEITKIIAYIKKLYPLDVLYGGSVNLKNIDHLKTITNVNGFLIGSGSVIANDFVKKIKSFLI